jgi:nitrogen regulatory protein P-II 1
MLKIEAYVQPFRLDAIKAALDGLGVEGASYCHVMECSGHLALKTVFRGSEYRVDSPRVKIEILVSSLDADDVVDAVLRAAQSGQPAADGLITVSEIAEAIRIKDGRRVQLAAR